MKANRSPTILLLKSQNMTKSIHDLYFLETPESEGTVLSNKCKLYAKV